MASQYGRMKWPGSQGANLRLCRLVTSAPGFADEPLLGKEKCPFLYGIESISGICNGVSNCSGRPTVWLRTKPLNNARAMPKAIPPPARPKAISLRILVTKPGGEGRWTALMLGILLGSKASSIRAFSRDAAKYL